MRKYCSPISPLSVASCGLQLTRLNFLQRHKICNNEIKEGIGFKNLAETPKFVETWPSVLTVSSKIVDKEAFSTELNTVALSLTSSHKDIKCPER